MANSEGICRLLKICVNKEKLHGVVVDRHLRTMGKVKFGGDTDSRGILENIKGLINASF